MRVKAGAKVGGQAGIFYCSLGTAGVETPHSQLSQNQNGPQLLGPAFLGSCLPASDGAGIRRGGWRREGSQGTTMAIRLGSQVKKRGVRLKQVIALL